MKKCETCGNENPDYGKLCHTCYQRKYRKEHPELAKERTKRNLIIYQKNRQFILDYKKDKYCVDCGYDEHTEILQFHHLDEDDKWHSIADSVTHLSRENMLKEMNKCILLCPNCHYWKHYLEHQKKREQRIEENQKINKLKELYKIKNLELNN